MGNFTLFLAVGILDQCPAIRNIGMAIGSSLLAVIVNYQVMKSVDRIVMQSESFTPEQLKLLRDPNVLMDTRLQSLIPEQSLL